MYEQTGKKRKKKKDRGIVDFLMIQNHFFPNFKQWIEEMLDPRHPSYTIYTQKDLVYMGILKNICSIESMRQMDEKFNEDKKYIFKVTRKFSQTYSNG